MLEKRVVPNSVTELPEYKELYALAVNAFSECVAQCEQLRAECRTLFREKTLPLEIVYEQARAKFRVIHSHGLSVKEAQGETEEALRDFHAAKAAGQQLTNEINRLERVLQAKFGTFEGSIASNATPNRWADTFTRRELPEYVDPVLLDQVRQKEVEAEEKASAERQAASLRKEQLIKDRLQANSGQKQHRPGAPTVALEDAW